MSFGTSGHGDEEVERAKRNGQWFNDGRKHGPGTPFQSNFDYGTAGPSMDFSITKAVLKGAWWLTKKVFKK